MHGTAAFHRTPDPRTLLPLLLVWLCLASAPLAQGQGTVRRSTWVQDQWDRPVRMEALTADSRFGPYHAALLAGPPDADLRPAGPPLPVLPVRVSEREWRLRVDGGEVAIPGVAAGAPARVQWVFWPARLGDDPAPALENGWPGTFASEPFLVPATGGAGQPAAVLDGFAGLTWRPDGPWFPESDPTPLPGALDLLARSRFTDLQLPLENVQHIAVASPFALFGQGLAGFEVMDMTDLAHPRRLGSWSCAPDTLLSVQFGGSNAWAVLEPSLGWTNAVVVGISLAEPAHPRHLGSLTLPPGDIHAFAASATHALVARRTDALSEASVVDFLDLSEPTLPRRLFSQPTRVPPVVALHGALAVWAETNRLTLRRLDAIDSTAAEVSLDLGPHDVHRLAVHGSNVGVLTTRGTLLLYRLTSESVPQWQGSIAWNAPPEHLVLSDRFALASVATPDTSGPRKITLHAVSLSGHGPPETVASCELSAAHVGIAMDGRRVLTADLTSVTAYELGPFLEIVSQRDTHVELRLQGQTGRHYLVEALDASVSNDWRVHQEVALGSPALLLDPLPVRSPGAALVRVRKVTP